MRLVNILILYRQIGNFNFLFYLFKARIIEKMIRGGADGGSYNASY